MAVVPWQYVGERNRGGPCPRAPKHQTKIRRRRLNGAPLRDVVDPALHDQGIRVLSARIEPRGDLVRPLPVDATVAKLESRVLRRRPVLPLALPVGTKTAQGCPGS